MGNLGEHFSSQVTTSSEAGKIAYPELSEDFVKLLPLTAEESKSLEELQRIKEKVRLLLEEERKKGRLLFCLAAVTFPYSCDCTCNRFDQPSFAINIKPSKLTIGIDFQKPEFAIHFQEIKTGKTVTSPRHES